MIEDHLEVTVAEVPGGRTELTVPQGATVQQAIDQSPYDADGLAIRMNSRDANANDRVSDGALITLSKRAAGA